nr:hypothetical protein [Tanacetum cinerariifolium]
MDVPWLLDHAFDFFAVELVSGLAEAPDNQNGWIEWDVSLGGPSTAIPVGHPLTTMAYGVATQPQGDPSLSDYFGGAGTDPADLIAWSLVAEPVVAD